MTQEKPQPSMVLVLSASSAGTVFEWYDFFIFGSLAGIIAQHFFAGVSESQAYLFALLTFAFGFAARPFGAVVFGRIGDAVGRKRAFLVTITVMGLATFAVAFLPDFDAIGIAAPVALVVIRVLQGFAIGGEYGGAAIYVAEHASAKRRGWATGWIQASAGLGLVLALAVIIVARTELGEDRFDDWGWRVPFGLSIALLAVSLWIRLRLEESPIFQKMLDEGRASKAPLRETFLRASNLRIMAIALVGLLMGQGVVWYTAQFYTQFFLERVIKLEPAVVNALVMVVTIASLPLYMFFAWLSDLIGRKPVMLFGLGLAAIAFIPGFQMLTQSANPALAEAALRVPVIVVAAPEDCTLQFDLIGKASIIRSCDIAKSTLTKIGIPYSNSRGPAGRRAFVDVGGRSIEAPDGTAVPPAAIAQAKAEFLKVLTLRLKQAGYPVLSAKNARIDMRGTILCLMIFIVAATALYGPQAAALVELFPARIRYTALSVPYHIGVGWFGGFLPATAFAIVASTGDIYAGLWYPVIIAALGFFVTLFFLPETVQRDITA
jgi:MFS family permease